MGMSIGAGALFELIAPPIHEVVEYATTLRPEAREGSDRTCP
jgi:hypothetical protein